MSSLKLSAQELTIKDRLIQLDNKVEESCVKVHDYIAQNIECNETYHKNLKNEGSNKSELLNAKKNELSEINSGLHIALKQSVDDFAILNSEKAKFNKQDLNSYSKKLKEQLINLKSQMKTEKNELINEKNQKIDPVKAGELKIKLKEITSKIKLEKKEINDNNKKSISKAKKAIDKKYAKDYINTYDQLIENSKRGVKQLATKEINDKYGKELKQLQNEYITTAGTISKSTLFIVAIIAIISVIVISLTINYLVYYPKTNNNVAYDFGKTSNIIAISLSGLLILLAGMTAFLLLKKSSSQLPMERKSPNFSKGLLIGIITDFFDTLGVGSFAPTIVMGKALNAYGDDKKIPGTLNVSHTIPVIMEAIIFIAAVEVNPGTLITLIASAVIGSFIGSWLANKVNGLMIKLIMGVVLFITAILMILNHPQIALFPKNKNGLNVLPFDDWKIYIASTLFIILGILMAFGVGLYAPSMAVVSLMGLDTDAAFPIMMGSTAFLMPFGSMKFMQDRNYEPKLSIGITIGGSVGVLTAFLLVFVGLKVGLGVGKDEFMNYLNWLVVIVIFYASYNLTQSYFKTKKQMLLGHYRSLI